MMQQDEKRLLEWQEKLEGQLEKVEAKKERIAETVSGNNNGAVLSSGVSVAFLSCVFMLPLPDLLLPSSTPVTFAHAHTASLTRSCMIDTKELLKKGRERVSLCAKEKKQWFVLPLSSLKGITTSCYDNPSCDHDG